MLATQTGLLQTLGGSVARGLFLIAATVHYPAVVLGAVAARTLGITAVPLAMRVYLGGQYFTVADSAARATAGIPRLQAGGRCHYSARVAGGSASLRLCAW